VRKKLKRFRIPIFALFILIPFCLAYSQYDSLAKIRFLFPITFETFDDEGDGDEEDLAIDPPVQIEKIILASSVNLSHLRFYSFKHFCPFSFQPFFFEKKIPLLRC
jgi:hypothetical protein